MECRRFIFRIALALTSSLTLAACGHAAPVREAAGGMQAPHGTYHSSFSSFITRSGSHLKDGSQDFRFIALELGAVHRNESDVLPDESDRWPNAYEISDQFQSVVQAGGTATRLYPLSFGADPRSNHVLGLDKYNETAFRTLDKVLQVANNDHVRVIIPFIDQYKYWGGVPQFSAWSGVSDKEFYSSPQCLENFKRLIHYVLNRRNTYTGVLYKDDKAILAWQLGNELWSTVQWEASTAAYIKSIDRHHLVAAGEHNSVKMLGDPNVDILDAHLYQYWSKNPNLAGICHDFRQKIGDKKVLIVGECGMGDTANIVALYDEVIQDGTSGCILWKALGHNRSGGFRFHAEEAGYSSYHWPGFAATDKPGDANLLRQTQVKAYEIRRLPLPRLLKPSAPALLPISSPKTIYWQGVTGANSYDIQRTNTVRGPWETLAVNISDEREYPEPEFADMTAVAGQSYYYRLRARNSAGVSPYSSPAGPACLP
ncbi:MAG: hypothetical protein ACRYFS_04985 [Janthinobacterium lividum]